MIAFRVSVNGQPPVVGGANDLFVLTAIVTASGLLGTNTHPSRPNEEGGTTINFCLGGLTSHSVGIANEHVVWLEDVELSPGDTVTVQVVESDRADPVTSSHEADAKEEYDRELFKFARAHYLALRDKYEPDM